jgi:hypothetical protein
MKSIKRKERRKNKGTRRTMGGRAIDAGSYGCVFKPAIKCADSTIPYSNKNISKLMYKEDTDAELIEMAKVKKFVERIPNKEDYFLISNTYECQPDKLNEEDLSYFDKKCRLFTKRGITSSEVNNKLNLMALIVMPNGGLNMEKFFLKMFEMPEKEMHQLFINTNTALIKLLVNGIVPLTKMGFNHYDVKAGNILMSEDGRARLIDWGLAGENDGLTVPETIQNRSIAFNMPFSDIFFNNFVKTWLAESFHKIRASPNLRDKTTGQKELLKIVAVNMINESIAKTSEGHYDYITGDILHDIYKVYASKNIYNRVDYNILTTNVLIEYVHAVLVAYVNENGNFDDAKYFYDVFSKNVDIWGFLLSYVPIIEFGAEKFHIDIVNAVCRILLKYCFSPEFATKPIILNELTLDLQSLNAIAAGVVRKHSKSPLVKSRSRKREGMENGQSNNLSMRKFGLNNNKDITMDF